MIVFHALRLPLAYASVMALLLLPSCSNQLLYVPPAHNVALPTQKGDGHFSMGIGSAGLQIQFAKALNHRLLLMAQVQGMEHTQSGLGLNIFSTHTTRQRQYSGGVGVGTYGPLRWADNLHWSVVGGYEWAHAYRGREGYKNVPDIRTAARRLYVQPACGYVVRRFEAVAALLIGATSMGPLQTEDAQLKGKKQTDMTLEPTLMASMGGPDVRFFVQIGLRSDIDSYPLVYGQLSPWTSSSMHPHVLIGCRVPFRKDGEQTQKAGK